MGSKESPEGLGPGLSSATRVMVLSRKTRRVCTSDTGRCAVPKLTQGGKPRAALDPARSLSSGGGGYNVLSSGGGGYSVRRASVPVCETPRCRAGLEPEGEHAVRCGLSTCRAQFLPSGSARQAAWAGGVRERCPKPASVSGGGPSQSVSDLTRSHGEKALELAFDPSSLRPWRAPSLTPKPVQSFVPEGAGRGLSLALLRLWN